MSTINGVNYQNALSILSQSPGNSEVGASTSAAKSIVKLVAQASASGTSPVTPTDTVSLSAQAKSYLTTTDNANNPPPGYSADSPDWKSATDGSFVNAAVEQLKQQAAARGDTAIVQNAADVPGLDFQETVQGIGVGGYQVSTSYNSKVFQSNPNNVIVFDSNPADAKMVTI